MTEDPAFDYISSYVSREEESAEEAKEISSKSDDAEIDEPAKESVPKAKVAKLETVPEPVKTPEKSSVKKTSSKKTTVAKRASEDHVKATFLLSTDVREDLRRLCVMEELEMSQFVEDAVRVAIRKRKKAARAKMEEWLTE